MSVLSNIDKLLKYLDNYQFNNDKNSSVELLTFGFVRQIIEHIDNWDVIPFAVINLCHSYYRVPINIFLICGNQYGKDTKVNGMTCINMNKRKMVNFKINNVISSESFSQNDDEKDEYDSKITETFKDTNDATLNEDWNTIKSGYCYTSKIDLPSFITSKYNELYDLRGRLCGIFKCGGRIASTFSRITNVSMMIFESKSLLMNKDEIEAFWIKLPSTPKAATVECIYSNYYGLFNIYDGTKEIYRLPFGNIYNDNNDVNYCKWNWMKMKNMNYYHYKGSTAFINDIDGIYNEKLFICGGHNKFGNKCELLDIRLNEWKILPNILYKVSQAGIKYDYCSSRIYIGGGSREYSGQPNSSKTCSFYDIVQDKWFKLPSTNYEHSNYPLVYINDSAPNLLCIAGNDQHDIGQCEFYDLRDNYKKWRNVNDFEQLNNYIKIHQDALIKRLCA
eukprot:196389_1